jgi:hypothetical protein
MQVPPHRTNSSLKPVGSALVPMQGDGHTGDTSFPTTCVHA